jgi:hypothetical protein
VATSREHTPEQRHDLRAEADELVHASAMAGAEPLAPNGDAPDSIISQLTSRGNVDAIVPVGRMRNMKRGVLKVSHVFLRDQAMFNRGTINALEELTARLDLVEARLAELEAGNDGVPEADSAASSSVIALPPRPSPLP